MSGDSVDSSKRRFLVQLSSAAGVVGCAGAVWPFVSYMNPGAAELSAGAPVEVDISSLEPGKLITVFWRKQPIWILHRTKQNLEELKKIEKVKGLLADPKSESSDQPDFAKNTDRSLKPEYLVLVGKCTHLGCTPKQFDDLGNGFAGFFCPCHGSKFDLAGRVYANVPAPVNLVVPPYKFLSNTKILIGEVDKEAAA
jgi:ubiquinol-cytochrome c reductase iron-sulfur subunit